MLASVFVFPGQGAQRKGMGADLFDRFPKIVAHADRVLGYSIKELCLFDPEGMLNRTEYTQPALYTVNALAFLAALKEKARMPAFVAGHSLGEYNALLAAGVFTFETGLRLVKKRGELMSHAPSGGMAAVIGLSSDEILDICRRNGFMHVYLANINSPFQVVIAGAEDEILACQPCIEACPNVRFVRLNVSGAFHSPLMESAADEFAHFCAQCELRPPSIPVISNVTARPYDEGQLPELLVRQLSSPVQWSQSVRYLLAAGADQFVEIGPGQVLSGLIAQIRMDASSMPPTVPTSMVEQAVK